jgi:peptide/nickel transport system substrate-binding protein
VQQGATVKSTARNPVGTGPFRCQSLTPGSHSVFTASKDYWESGKPYVDQLVVDSSFTDTNALFSALLAGKINLFPSAAEVTARQQLTAKQVQILESPVAAQSYMFAMRWTRARSPTTGSGRR